MLAYAELSHETVKVTKKRDFVILNLFQNLKSRFCI